MIVSYVVAIYYYVRYRGVYVSLVSLNLFNYFKCKHHIRTFFCILRRILWASPQLSAGKSLLSTITLAASTYCFLSSSDINFHFSATLWFFSFNDGNAFPSNITICYSTCIHVTCMLCVCVYFPSVLKFACLSPNCLFYGNVWHTHLKYVSHITGLCNHNTIP